MSDRLKDLEVELRDVVVALKDIAGTQWYDLGLQLQLSPFTLDTIAAHHNVDDHKRMMLRKWLQIDPEASWEKLAAALALIGHKTIAAVIRRQFSVVTTEDQGGSDNSTEEDKMRLILTRKNLNKIKGQFSSLLVEVQSALKSNQVGVDKVHSFLVHYFSRDDWIYNYPSNFNELFNALSVAKLWNYDHYDLLEEITKRLLPNDADVKKLIFEYKGQLSGFYTTTKIADFIKLSNFEDSEQDPQQPLPVHTYTMKDYRKLKLKLKIERKVSAVTLSYVDELWRSLAEEFDLPSLTAVIDSIMEGSLVVTWLILPHIAEKIVTTSTKAVKFFRHHGIVLVEIDSDTIYDEEKIIEYEDRLFEICTGEESEDVSILGELYSRGVDFNMFDSEGYTPLCLASHFGNSNVVKILLEHGAHVNKRSKDEWGITPLMAACYNGYVNTAEVLVENGALVDLPNKVGQSPLYVASGYRQRAAMRFLIEHGADVNLPMDDAVECSILIAACLDGFADVARMLLEHGATVDYQDKEGDSALFASSTKGYVNVVKVLLEFGAQVNLQTSDINDIGVTPLTIACANGHTAIAEVLIEHGAIVDFNHKRGRSALYETSSQGKTEAVRLLLQNKADVNLPTEDGLSNTALIAACSRGYSETARVLLDHGAKVDHQNMDGWTAIFYAAQQGYTDIVKLLINHGVELRLKDQSGLTAYDVASVNSHPAVCHLMEMYKIHHSTSSETKSVEKVLYTRHQCEEITSLQTFRSILERGQSDEDQDVPLKHQTSHMSEESEETCDLHVI